MRKTFKYRLYPTEAQEEILDRWLYLCRRLYNTCLEQRQIAYKMGYRVSVYAQQHELPQLKQEFPEYAQIGAHVLQDVAKRLESSFQRFFKQGAGHPKFQGRNRYDSFTYPDPNSWKLNGERLLLSKCGTIRLRMHRPLEGRVKTLTIKRRAGQWFACFSCDDVPAPAVPATDKTIGIDLGIEALATTSDGDRFENARYLRRKQKHLRRLQRHLARQKKGSNRRRRTVRQLQRLHMRIANQRADAHHKASTALIRQAAVIVHEAISPQFMLRNRRLAQAAADVGWSQFLTFLKSKAAAAGRTVIAVDPRNTSQLCSGCGTLVKKALHVRWHECPACGTSLHRDHNAALNILRAAG